MQGQTPTESSFDVIADKFPELAQKIIEGTATIEDYQQAWHELQMEINEGYAAFTNLETAMAQSNNFATQMEGIFKAIENNAGAPKAAVEEVIGYLKDLQQTAPEVYDAFVSEYSLDGIVALDPDDLEADQVSYIFTV